MCGIGSYSFTGTQCYQTGILFDLVAFKKKKCRNLGYLKYKGRCILYSSGKKNLKHLVIRIPNIC